MTWGQWRQKHILPPRVPDRQVIDSPALFVYSYSLSVGAGSRHHFVRVARFLVGLVHDDRTKSG
jgi:hypothetical protein